MAGSSAQSAIAAPPPVPAGTVAFEPARPADDPGIRRLLREQPLGGQVKISLEREPAFEYAAAIEGEPHHAVVARGLAANEIVALGSRAVRPVWVNGEPARMGYLGLLRRAPALEGRLQLLAAGFAELAKTRRPDEFPYDLTSIIADNRAARRLLEYGLPGLPAYRPLCEYTALMIPVRKRARRSPVRVQQAAADLLPAIVDCLQRNLRRYQFAPVWSQADLESPERTRGLRPEDFLVVLEGDQVVACLARWDQRGFKQTVLRGYAPRLARWRPVVNAGLRLMGKPLLPEPGQALNFAYLSHVAVDDDRADLLIDLVRAARCDAARAGLDSLVIGMAAGNPMLPALQRSFPGYACKSVLYLVDWDDGPRAFQGLDERIPHVEVATL